MTEVPAGANDRNEPRVPKRPRTGGGLHFYKAGQGYYTRMFTAIGGVIVALWAAAALFDQLSSLMDPTRGYYYPVSYGLTVALVLGLGGAIYWLVGLSRRPNDFFIATEGEMKKVSWSTRKEVIRSTKVVIVTVFMLSLLLFIADLFFMWFFGAIGVLKTHDG